MLADFQLLVEKAVRDDSGLITPDDIDVAIGLALSRYASDRPRYVVEDLAANGTDALDLPEAWDTEVSSISQLEYPIGSFPPAIAETDAYGLYQAPTGFMVRLAFTPTAPVRITYSVGHSLTDTVDTVPVGHREAVSCWAAAHCCDQLARFYAGAGDSTIQADRVERGSQSRDFAREAKTLRARYLSELGLEEKKFVAAGTVVDLDLTSSLGQDRFTHPRRLR